MSLITSITFTLIIIMLIYVIEKWMPLIILWFIEIIILINLNLIYGYTFTGNLQIYFALLYISLIAYTSTKIIKLGLRSTGDTNV